jgi:hypothetical protein
MKVVGKAYSYTQDSRLPTTQVGESKSESDLNDTHQTYL